MPRARAILQSLPEPVLEPLPTWSAITSTIAGNIHNGDYIRCENPEDLKRVIATLNAKPLGYVIGPEDEIQSISAATPENANCDFFEDLAIAQARKDDDETIYGLFLLPLSQDSRQ